MRQNERRLIIAAVATAWLGGLGHSEAIAQRARLLEFGPDTIEIRPPRRAATDTAAVPLDGPDPRERPWVLASVRGLRLPPPPDERDSARERQEMWKLAASDDADALERVRYWDTPSPAQRWREMLADMSARAELSGAAASRARALLDTAIHDARIAAWDSKNAYRRPRPSELDARLVPEVAVPRGPSYPCEHAVVAGVAAEILGHLFPRDRTRLAGAAHEAAWSRVVASAVYPSDAKAGLALGRAVAELVIEQAIIGDRERLQEAPAVAGRPQARFREDVADVDGCALAPRRARGPPFHVGRREDLDLVEDPRGVGDGRRSGGERAGGDDEGEGERDERQAWATHAAIVRRPDRVADRLTPGVRAC